jgi:parallel beta-helix repeat protein
LTILKKAGRSLRRIASSLIVALLFLGLFVLAFTVQSAKAEFGTIYIEPDGRIYPSTAPIKNVGNVTYTLTDNINESILVLRNNIILDGAGYAVQGTGNGTGIALSGRSNVTIRNMTIEAFYRGVDLNSSYDCTFSKSDVTANTRWGIVLNSSSRDIVFGNNITNDAVVGVYLWSSFYCNVTGNTITDNECGVLPRLSSGDTVSGNNITANSLYGLYLDSSPDITILGNNITNSRFGVELFRSSRCTVSGNMFTNDGFFVDGSSYGSVVLNNLVNGKPLVYLENVSGYTVSDAGQVVLVGCNGIVAENLDLSNATTGIELWGTANSEITNNTMANEFSGVVFLYLSHDNTVSRNDITNNGIAGVYFEYSSNNTLSGNNITNNSRDGIQFFHSSSCTVAKNDITNNSRDGIVLNSSSSCTVSANNITNNGEDGIVLNSSSNNKFFHNNFINTEQVASQSSTNVWDASYPSGGNYWSDYTGVDQKSGPGQNLNSSDGIGDVPYTIDSSNQDRYPLMHRWSFLSVHNINTGLGYSTIQEAINASQTLNGQTIFVDEGIHYENVVISKTITLVGADQLGTIIDGKGKGNVVQIGANDVNLMNLNIRNAGRNWGPPPGNGYPDSCIIGSGVANISVENCALSGAAVCAWFVYSSSVNVTDSIMLNATYMGLVGYASSNAIFQDNLVASCGLVGVHLDGDSTNCKIVNNTVANCPEGIEIEKSAGNFVDGNQLVSNNVSIVFNQCPGLNVLRENNMTSHWYNLIVWGWTLEAFEQNIDSSNTVNNKTVYYLTNSRNLTISPSDYPNMGYLAIVNCTNVEVKDVVLSFNKDGIQIAQSTNCSFENITLIGNNGPLLYGGLTFFESNDNLVVNSLIGSNSAGACFYQSNGNTFYHNSFINNTQQVISNFYSPFSPPSGSCSANIWDNGYPSGGNYWSDYRTRCPNAVQNDSSATWNTPNVIDSSNSDRYPLMDSPNSFNVGIWNGVTYSVDTVSNSTLSNFNFNATAKTLTFNVTSTSGTLGFCRVAIPMSLMSCVNPRDWTVMLNYTQLPLSLNVTTSTNYTYLYFTYSPSTETVKIQSTNASPEFQPFVLIPLFMIATLLGAMILKRKRNAKLARPAIIKQQAIDRT